MLKRTNLETKLSKLSASRRAADDVLREVYEILAEDERTDKRIAANIAGGKSGPDNRLVFDALDPGCIYHLEQIREICITYRLRFLDSRYFKGEIPHEAVTKVKALERRHQTELKGFKILAPSRLFKLEDKDDPLLFAPIGNGYYYLIHKWGNDLNPFRKWLVWPFKNVGNLGLVVILMSFLLTLMVPDGLFSKQHATAEFWILFFFMFKSLAAVVIFYGFALGKNFNPAIWNSKFFNA